MRYDIFERSVRSARANGDVHGGNDLSRGTADRDGNGPQPQFDLFVHDVYREKLSDEVAERIAKAGVPVEPTLAVFD